MKKGKVVSFILVFILIIVVGGYYFINTPKKVSTKYSFNDYKSFAEKFGLSNPSTIEKKITTKDLLENNFTASNPVELTNVTFSAAEIASFVNESLSDDVLTNFNLGFTDEYVIITFDFAKDMAALIDIFPELKTYTSYLNFASGKSVYWTLTIEKESDKTFMATTHSIYVGQYQLPINDANLYLTNLGSSINSILTAMIDFKIIDFSYNNNGLLFSGILPTKFEY